MQKRILTLFLAVGMLVSIFSGCAGNPQPAVQSPAAGDVVAPPTVQAESPQEHYLKTGEITGDKVSLRWLHRYPEEQYAPFFQSLADGYTKDHPNVDIKVEVVGDEAIKDKLRVMVGGGDTPDVFYSWAGEFAAKFLRADAIIDLTPYVEADTTWKDSISDTFWGISTIHDKIAGVPFRFNSGVFYYNKNVLTPLGIEPPKTWAELEAACQKLKDNGFIPISYGNAQPWHSAWWFGALFEQTVPKDVRLTDYDPTTGVWTDPGYVQALSLMQSMQAKGYLNENINSMTYSQSKEMFHAGKSAMYFSGIMGVMDTDKILGAENWDWMPFPTIEGAKGTANTVVGSADLFMVSSASKHPEIGVDFLKSVTSLENQTKMMKETGLAPTANGAMTTENTNPKILRFLEYLSKESNGLSEYFDTATEARVCDKWLENFQLVYDGKDPQTIVKEVQEVSKVVSAELG